MAPPPVVRTLELTLPETFARGLCFALGVGIAAFRTAHVVDRIAFAHKRFAEIRNIAGGADSKRTSVAIPAVGRAGNAALGNQLGKPGFCCPSALPVAALRVAAGLTQFRGVNPDQPDIFAAGL